MDDYEVSQSDYEQIIGENNGLERKVKTLEQALDIKEQLNETLRNENAELKAELKLLENFREYGKLKSEAALRGNENENTNHQ